MNKNEIIKKILSLFLPSLLLATIVIAIISITLKHSIKEINSGSQLVEIKEFLNFPLKEILIQPTHYSRKNFLYKIDETKELDKIRKQLKNICLSSPSGHSGPIYESIMILKTRKGELKYLASVHKYEKKDLFITRLKDMQKDINSIPMSMRVFNLGRWILDKAPKGKL